MDGRRARALRGLLAPTRALVLSDEAYEHGVRRRAQRAGPARFGQRVVSASARLSTTGWGRLRRRAGRADARVPQVHQFNVFTARPMQHGWPFLADASHWRSLPSAVLPGQRRPLPRRAGHHVVKLPPCEGTYFQCVDYSALSDKTDLAYRGCASPRRSAAIPMSAFYERRPARIRFCFARRRPRWTRLGRLQRKPTSAGRAQRLVGSSESGASLPYASRAATARPLVGHRARLSSSSVACTRRFRSSRSTLPPPWPGQPVISKLVSMPETGVALAGVETRVVGGSAR